MVLSWEHDNGLATNATQPAVNVEPPIVKVIDVDVWPQLALLCGNLPPTLTNIAQDSSKMEALLLQFLFTVGERGVDFDPQKYSLQDIDGECFY